MFLGPQKGVKIGELITMGQIQNLLSWCAGMMEDQGWELVPSYQLKHIDSGPAPKVEQLHWTGHNRMIRICQVRISIAS